METFPRYWPFVWGIHRSPVNSPHKGQWRGTLMFSLIYAWIIGWVNNGEAGDRRRHGAHYDVTEISFKSVNSEDMLRMRFMRNSCEIALRWMPENIGNIKSTMVNVMACCHYLSQWLPRSMSPYGFTKPQWIKLSCCRWISTKIFVNFTYMILFITVIK